MENVKHTPAPWYGLDDNTSGGLHIRGGAHHYPIAKMCSYWDGPGPREDEAKANYALMVAAPELLKAIELLVGSCENESVRQIGLDAIAMATRA